VIYCLWAAVGLSPLKTGWGFNPKYIEWCIVDPCQTPDCQDGYTELITLRGWLPKRLVRCSVTSEVVMYIDTVVLSGIVIVAATFAVIVYLGFYGWKKIKQDTARVSDHQKQTRK
jgi:hypothetical protein